MHPAQAGRRQPHKLIAPPTKAAAADLVRRSNEPSSAESDWRKVQAETISCSSLGTTTIRNCTGSIVMDTIVSNGDSSNFSLGSSEVRAAHWNDSKGYVDTQFSNWQSSNGRPVQGSSATLMAGQDKALITVESSSSSQVSYRVQLSSGVVAKSYQVLASYSGSTVSYSVKAL
ncbi:hypothetical protein [Roseateles sp.]|uniref:hypothetical protein n=1 Tax=Roseateles sp. TaxID=1971397 RepID=UPI003D13B675